MLFSIIEKRRVEKEKRLIRDNCPHEYHIVSTQEIDVGAYTYDWVKHHDLYCPICDSLVEKVSDRKAKCILKIQEVRKKTSGSVLHGI